MKQTTKRFRKDLELNDSGMEAFVRKAQKQAKYDKKHNYSKTQKRGSGKPRPTYYVEEWDY